MRLLKTKIQELDFWYRSNDKFVGQRIALGKYEEYETKLLLRRVSAKGGDAVVVDVGANIGYYTVLMAQRAKKVYAIEPDKEIFEILKKNVEDNNLKNVVLLNMAVGAKKGKLNYFKNIKNQGDGRVYNPSKSPFDKGDLVKCVSLDDILENEEKIDLIKIDTQGWEPEVIEGAKKIIKRDVPTLFMEYWPKAYQEAKLDSGKMKQFLHEYYRYFWQIDPELGIFRNALKNIKIDTKIGYADLWLSNSEEGAEIMEQFRDLKLKNLLKSFWGRIGHE